MSAAPVLYIGNKNYSSWSLRPWLLMQQFGLAFEDRVLWLDTPQFAAEVAAVSPSKRVPVLHHDGRVVWDSLAICEYVNDTCLDGRGWPRDPSLRALARSAACEMHSSFGALRQELPMNCARQPNNYRWSEAAAADIERVQALWSQLRQAAAGQGEFLCGEFGIVDAMFAPVVLRFRGYGAPLSPVAQAYVEHMLAQPALRAWIDAGVAEPARLTKYEALK
ncbi:glutathione S-transferase family protein [Aquimonas sp.]|jgi:glutathione S-transferase|uniref:glutathione S-transferase family protein n=1 Tax=Aquimonas sp. TaxID=1872588 RepID=UPI0037BE5B56